jgi:membrane-bound lytic murein transglycosylase D
MEERIPMSGTPRARLAVTLAALAAVLTGCATQSPTRSDWPMVPSARRTHATPPPAAATPAAPAARSELLSAVPPAAEYADIFDRIRAGYGLPEVDHPAIDQQLRFYASKPEYLDRTFERAERYLYYVVSELELRKMPLELAMLPVVESAYNPYAYSRARAAGLWQFIPPTAARYQVRVNWWQDGRRDVIDSTRAALDYLQGLNELFDGDWLLAMAAYNCGEGCVQRAIDRNRAAGLPTDYFSLRLPDETRAYVPKLIAMARIVANPADFGLEFAQIENEPYFARVEVGSQMDLRLAAQLAGVTDEEMHALNPAFNRWATDPDGPHHLLVPFEIAPEFQAAVEQLAPQARMPLERHRVRPGDTVATLARSRNVPPSAIQRLNDVAGSKLPIGEEILLPASTSVAPLRAGLIIEGENPPGAARRAKRSKTYVVRRGDTLWAIAKKNNVGVYDLARMNGLKPTAPLKAGRRLVVNGSAAGNAGDGSAKAAPVRTAAKSPGGSKRASDDAGRRVKYTVRRGDTLHEISRRFDVTVAQLREWNRLPGARIKPGQKIVVYVDNDYGG